MTKSRDGQKEQKLRYKCQVTGLQQLLHQAREDLLQASIGRQDQGAGIGATDASYFELQLAETRGRVRERDAEVDAYRKAFDRATAAKEDAETKHRLYRERMTQELLVAESKVAHLQTINESNSAKLYDSRPPLPQACLHHLPHIVRGSVCREDYSTFKSKATMFDDLVSRPTLAPQDAATSAEQLSCPT